MEFGQTGEHMAPVRKLVTMDWEQNLDLEIVITLLQSMADEHVLDQLLRLRIAMVKIEKYHCKSLQHVYTYKNNIRTGNLKIKYTSIYFSCVCTNM